MPDSDVARAVRADVAHLLDLWDMLPMWRDTEFWAALSRAENRDPNNEYFPGKMHSIRHLATEFLKRDDRQPGTYTLGIAQYVLMFFDRDDEAMFKVLDRVGISFEPSIPGTLGRRWAQDAAATAWRIYAPSAAAIRRDERSGTPNDPPWIAAVD